MKAVVLLVPAAILWLTQLLIVLIDGGKRIYVDIVVF